MKRSFASLFKFEKKDGVIKSLSYHGKDNTITIPDTFEGESITYIRTIIFYYSDFSEVVLPDSLTKIDSININRCASLKELNLPENLTCVNKIIIRNCNDIKSIKVLNSTIKIEKVEIKNCDSLNEVSECLWDYLDTITQLNVIINKFENWVDLYTDEQIKVINLLKNNKDLIDDLLNSDCFAAVPIIIDANIPISLFHTHRFLELSIQNQYTAITAVLLEYKNKNFTADEIEKFHIQLEKSEIGLEFPTFEQLRNKWDLIVEENNIFIVGYRGNNDVEIIPNEVIEGMKISGITRSGQHNFLPIKHLTLQENIEVLGNHAFESCGSLISINIKNTSIDYISIGCFSCCYSLKEISIPNGVKRIMQSAFQSCISLEKVLFPLSLNTIEEGAFVDCDKLETLTFPPNLCMIEDFAFEDCHNLKQVEFLGVVDVSETAFENCYEIEFLENY